MDVHAPVGPDQKAYVKYLATMFSVIAKKVMVKWSMTQVLSSHLTICGAWQLADDLCCDILGRVSVCFIEYQMCWFV